MSALLLSGQAVTRRKNRGIYPSGVLPDLRGEFIRGWDDGRGVDVGRELLSVQGFALQNIIGSFTGRPAVGASAGALVEATGAMVNRLASGNKYIPLSVSGSTAPAADTVSFDASRVVNTATETRPRNVAFLYIVRAA